MDEERVEENKKKTEAKINKQKPSRINRIKINDVSHTIAADSRSIPLAN